MAKDEIEARRAEQRERQRGYRERHARRIANVREIGNILMRQRTRRGDVEKLARLLHAVLDKDFIKALRKALAAPKE
jgi:hypothetical protein